MTQQQYHQSRIPDAGNANGATEAADRPGTTGQAASLIFTAAVNLRMQGNLVDAISKSAGDAAAIRHLCHRLASSPAARKRRRRPNIQTFKNTLRHWSKMGEGRWWWHAQLSSEAVPPA